MTPESEDEDRQRSVQIGAAIVAGYQDQPQNESEVGWADAASARMIADEPWTPLQSET